MDKVKAGQYYYSPHRSGWGVWRKGKEDAGGTRKDDFIMDFSTKTQARNFVYKANGWLGNKQD